MRKAKPDPVPDPLNRTLTVHNSRLRGFPLPKLSRSQRAAKFRAIEAARQEREQRDYFGCPQVFEPAIKDVDDPSTRSRYEPCDRPCCSMLIRSDGGINSHYPGAPQTRTWQLERTVASR